MRQVINLAKIAAFCKDVTLREDRQSELRKQSLDFWKIPDKARMAPFRLFSYFYFPVAKKLKTLMRMYFFTLGWLRQKNLKIFYQIIPVSKLFAIKNQKYTSEPKIIDFFF